MVQCHIVIFKDTGQIRENKRFTENFENLSKTRNFHADEI